MTEHRTRVVTDADEHAWTPGGQTDRWWRDGVLYQIYVRYFQDSDGDGHGDLPGLRARLEYVEWLGASGIWLTPINPSPDADWGYDVSDYYAVHPDFGDLSDFDGLLADAHAHGLRVVLDLVANHTSDRHPWFEASRSSRDNAKRDWYVWADPKPDGSPPNNWIAMFGGSAWRFDERTEQYYLHNFTAHQPDLNWWCDEVRDEFDRVLRFWFDRGVDGFRLDACQAIVKDRLLRDNPLATPDDRPNVRLRGQRPFYSMNRPEVHDVLQRWRRVADAHPHKPILLGETNVHDIEALARYYGAHPGDELHLAFNFPFMDRPFNAEPLRDSVARAEAALPAHAQPIWTVSNHDAPRYMTRWCGDDQSRARAALLLLLCLRGTPMVYYGDELALADSSEIAAGRSRDPLALGTLPGKESRDPCRTPMPWEQRPGLGFCPDDVEPWLPARDGGYANVELQLEDPDSHLRFFRDLVALRRERPELYQAPMTLAGDDDVLVLGRGRCTVYLNLSPHPRLLTFGGEVVLATQRHQAGAIGEVELLPWQGAIVAEHESAQDGLGSCDRGS
jgi:alpha-glucosidase